MHPVHSGGGPAPRSRIVIQRKTGRPVQFELLETARASLLASLQRRGGSVDDHAFPSRIDHQAHISTRQYARLVDEWVTAIGLRREDYSTHSLRRTKASIIYIGATGNLRAVQILLGHTKIESAVRYLGVDVENALKPSRSQRCSYSPRCGFPNRKTTAATDRPRWPSLLPKRVECRRHQRSTEGVDRITSGGLQIPAEFAVRPV